MSIKSKIFKELEKKGYITDDFIYEIYKGEPNFATAADYKEQYYRLKNDINFFKDKEIIEKVKARRSYLVRVKEQETYYKVCKDFYLMIKTI